MLAAEGPKAVFHRHRLVAEATRRAVGTWAEGQAIAFNVSEAEERSDTVTTVITRNGASAQPLVDYCRENCGVVLGRGLGPLEGKAFRNAHMGHVNAPMIFGRSEEHTSELQSRSDLVCRLLLEKKKDNSTTTEP